MAGDDAALWARVRSGGAEAFGLLFERYGQAIYGYCFRRTADADRAADLTSITFLEAWRRREVALPGDKVLPWVFGVATNVLRNERRNRRRYKAALDRLPATLDEQDFAERRQTGSTASAGCARRCTSSGAFPAASATCSC